MANCSVGYGSDSFLRVPTVLFPAPLGQDCYLFHPPLVGMVACLIPSGIIATALNATSWWAEKAHRGTRLTLLLSGLWSGSATLSLILMLSDPKASMAVAVVCVVLGVMCLVNLFARG